jgi:hypothetical protein
MKYILITLLSLFSIAATAQDTIKIPTHVAKQIAKDLIKCDSVKAELSFANQQINLLNKKVVLKDSIIVSHEQKGIMYETRIQNEQLKFDTQANWVKDLQKQNKKLKAKLIFTKITFTGAIVGLTYLYITK